MTHEQIIEATNNGDPVEVLALELARDVNNTSAINSWVTHVIENDLWRSRTVMGRSFSYRSFESFVESPLSRGGLASDIKVIIGNAMTDAKVYAVLAPVLSQKTTEDVVAKAKQMEATRKIENLPPKMSPEEKSKRARDRYHGRPTQKFVGQNKREAAFLRLIQKRADSGDEKAKEALRAVKAGEVTVQSAAARLYRGRNRKVTVVKTAVRALDADLRAEFFQWLKDEGVCSRIDINPEFTGFPRKPQGAKQ